MSIASPRPAAAIALLLAISAGCSAPREQDLAQAVRDRAAPAPAAPPVPKSEPLAMRVAQEASFMEPVARGETYAALVQNGFLDPRDAPLSTFSVDVDTGSYANVRRMLAAGALPPADAVRTEEFLNYFDYAYPAPDSPQVPFSVLTELAPAPWDARRWLLLVGLEGYGVEPAAIPASRLVFLVDTSGSMQSPEKLGLLKQSLALLAAQMRPQDSVAIVAYAGSAGLVLPPTSGRERGAILAALERLQAGGSTNGGAGLQLAYAVAAEQFHPDGVNRVVLATDGDFNVGTTSLEALKALVAEQRGRGIALTTLGVGTGNYNDALAEQLADIGDGNHAYIDSLEEGHKVLVDELSSTMLTIARDVKLQLAFAPGCVARYRLLGYENRLLDDEDFDDDRVDAGEIGAGHDVTALYEIEPGACSGNAEVAALRLRFKPPHADASDGIATAVRRADLQPAGPRLQLAATVAAFAEALRGGEYAVWTLAEVADQAERLRIADPFGHVDGFRRLARQAAALDTEHPQVTALSPNRSP